MNESYTKSEIRNILLNFRLFDGLEQTGTGVGEKLIILRCDIEMAIDQSRFGPFGKDRTLNTVLSEGEWALEADSQGRTAVRPEYLEQVVEELHHILNVEGLY